MLRSSRRSGRRVCALLFSVALTFTAAAERPSLYVNAAATGANDGSTWEDAYTDLHVALARGNQGGSIWVARGVYRPGMPGQTDLSFHVGSRYIYGGFAGNETEFARRDILANPTILSGDLLGDDGPEFANRADNSAVVVVLQGALAFNGFHVRGGVQSGLSPGGTVSQCVFEDNSGAAVSSPGSVSLQRCWLLGNGGPAVEAQGRVSLTNCIIQRNGLLTSEPAVVINPQSNSSRSYIFHCTMLDNPFGAVFAGGASDQDHIVYITNSILRGSGSDAFSGTVRRETAWCNIENWLTSDLNNSLFWKSLDTDPMFADRDGQDGIPGTTDDNLRLAPGSPCIDAGRRVWFSALTDFDGTPRILSCQPDIGAFETWAHIRDCDANGVADACEVSGDPALDVDENELLDRCEAWYADCNENGVADRCESDSDGDGVIDECENLTLPLRLENMPADVEVTAISNAGAYVAFGLPTVSGGVGTPRVTADFESGTLLRLGTRVITVTATDDAGATVSGVFRVTVQPPPQPDPIKPNADDYVEEPPVESVDPAALPCLFWPGVSLMLCGLVAHFARGNPAARSVHSPRVWLLFLMCVGIGLAPVNEVVATDCNNNGIPDETEWGSNSPHVYVNWAATGANTGQTWDNAHTDLQTGLCTARRLAPFYARVEIHVAAGVYRPAGAANPEIAFEFRDDDYRVNGGYSRNAAGQWVRDIDGTPTILDGDLLGNDGPDFANFDDNSHCVILVLGEDASLELDGLHIRGGNAPYGGAGISTEGRLSLTQCRLYENRAQTSGGAVFAYHAHVTASRTLFRGNQASIGTAICAPGIGFSNCVISGNPPFSLIPGSDAIFHKPQAEWGVQLYFCTIVGNAGGATNLSSTYDTSIFWRNGDTPPAAPDPLFVDEDGPDGVLGTSDDNYRLTAESPYVNAAIDLGWSVDYAGQPREQQCQADAGAFESPYAPDCDGDGQGDHCQIDANRSLDTNRNRRLDRCEPCIFTDCNANGLLDAFEPDSDGDGLIDACDDFPRDPSRWFKPPLRMQPCPTDLVLSAQSDRGAVVAIAPPAADGGLGAVRVTSDAPADGLFPIGDTLVTVTARDEADAVVTCSFRITVRPLAN